MWPIEVSSCWWQIARTASVDFSSLKARSTCHRFLHATATSAAGSCVLVVRTNIHRAARRA